MSEPETNMAPAAPTGQEERKGPSLGFWRDVWKRYRVNRRSMIALYCLVFLGFVGLFSPFLAGTKPILCKYKGSYYCPCIAYYQESWENPVFALDKFRGSYPANLQKKDPGSWAIWPLFYADPDRKTREKDWRGIPGFEKCVEADNSMPPSWAHPCGTDELGRSALARMIHGTRIALLVGFVSMGIAGAIGLTVGSVAGYVGGWVDMALSRFMDVVLSVPSIILMLALIAIVEKPDIWKLMVVIGATSWVGIARLTRGEFLKLKTLDYVTAARALGLSTSRVIVRHVLPNALAPALVSISFGIAGAILVESGLSFLGFGSPPPTPSWGSILRSGFADYSQWWLILFPGLAVFYGVFTYNLIGDGLQQAIDPRLR
jgi:peptide/nickel transport system permease protein